MTGWHAGLASAGRGAVPSTMAIYRLRCPPRSVTLTHDAQMTLYDIELSAAPSPAGKWTFNPEPFASTWARRRTRRAGRPPDCRRERRVGGRRPDSSGEP